MLQQIRYSKELFDELFQEYEWFEEQIFYRPPELPLIVGPRTFASARLSLEQWQVVKELEVMLPQRVEQADEFFLLYKYYLFAYKFGKKDFSKTPLEKLKAALRQKAKDGTSEEKKQIRWIAFRLAMTYSQDDLWDLVEKKKAG